jgi:hypothetical protein
LGHGSPSDPAFKRLCAVLAVNKRDMAPRLASDGMVFKFGKFGDSAWTRWGIKPKAGPFYICFPNSEPIRSER